MLKIENDSKIYICCPRGAISGGPEALHQLNYYLRLLGYNSFIAYWGYLEGEVIEIPARYRKYCEHFMNATDIIDDEKNILIVPESKSKFLQNFSKIQKCTWWLSVVYRDWRRPSAKSVTRALLSIIKRRSFESLNSVLKDARDAKGIEVFNDVQYHFVGSKFAYEYLTGRGLKNVKYLVEPISKEFLDAGISTSNIEERSDYILYNPAKESKIMKKLLKCEEFQFKPIKGYTPHQLIELYRSCKLYIDFGEFGGPERIPKETVYNDCALLVGKRNATVNDFDVAIRDEYKIENYNDIDVVKNKIKYMLENYYSIIGDFEPFKKKINDLEKNFINQIKENFGVNSED